jgi:hypothetical protein
MEGATGFGARGEGFWFLVSGRMGVQQFYPSPVTNHQQPTTNHLFASNPVSPLV